MTNEQLEQRIVALERELYRTRLRVGDTWLIDPSPIKRSLAVYGHCIVGHLLIWATLGVVALFLILVISFAVSLGRM